MQTKSRKGWRVTAHPDAVRLSSAVFVVRQAGRKRVLREKRKNVHAWIEGELIRELSGRWSAYKNRAYYNPYTCAHWVGPRGVQLIGAKRVVVECSGLVTYNVASLT
jgi:hypothetical protein